MEMITITHNNVKTKVQKGTTYLEISKYSKFKDTVLGIKKNNEILSLHDKADKEEEIEFFDVNTIEGSKIYQGALKFLLEVAIKTLYENSDVSYLHSVPGGILAEIEYKEDLKNEDIIKVKKEMENLINEDYPFQKFNILKQEVLEFYKHSKTLEKASNLQICDKIVTVYKLKDFINYFYVEMPYSTKYIKLFDIKYIGNNRLIILHPSNLTNGKMPEYLHHENIIKSFYDGASWLKRLNTPYVSEINHLVSEGKIKGYIESCELRFTDQIKLACDEILSDNNRRFIMIAGPSSSGKTTTTRVLGAYLRSKGYDPICISVDNYFLERVDTPKNEKGEYDFESIKAIDIELFNSHLNDLLEGKEVSVPTFNFITGKKEYNNNIIKLKENSILLIEGLHCLNDELTPSIDKKYKYKIYLSPFIPLNVDRHNYISTTDLRLIRRMIRDHRTRGYDVTSTIKGWQNVRNGEVKYIFPYTHEADIIINTALPYELGVLRVYVEPLLLSITSDSPYYEEARRLVGFLRIFYPISSEYVTENSILREFIGGNNND